MRRFSTGSASLWAFPLALAAGVAIISGCGSSDSPSQSDGSSIFLSVLPPGDNGNSAGGKGLPIPGLPVKEYPVNFVDQLSLYGDISYAQQDLQASPCKPPLDISEHVASSNQACNYFKHEGLTPDRVVSTETLTAPSGGVLTIQRDGWGVPFVHARNRADAMYGFGWASAEDRLWLYDVLRNFGRGRLSEFLGPSGAFYSYDSGLAGEAGYSEDEMTNMVTDTVARFGTLGSLVQTDIDNDVAGINDYIQTLKPGGVNAAQKPPEYAILKNGGFPPPAFTANDIVASAVLIQSIFATGGGGEANSEALLQQLDPGLGAGSTTIPSDACTLWRDLRHANDPDTPRSIDATFVQSPAALDESCPQTLPAGAAIWDVGSFRGFTAFSAENTPQPAAPLAQLPQLLPAALDGVLSDSMVAANNDVVVPLRRRPPQLPPGVSAKNALNPLRALRAALRAAGFGLPNTMSNFIGITADQSVDGHPIAVMGPQTSYFVPQLLWEVAIRSDGGTPQDFNGRGIVFANLPYIDIGRGSNYAFSATSGMSDLDDVRVSKMCNLNGTPPSRDDNNGDGFPDADGYLYDDGDGNGPQCRRFYERVDTWTAKPTVASIGTGGGTQSQLVTRYILRTHYGPVFATATVAGVPVAISTQRSTFLADLDTAAPFALDATPTVHGAASFQKMFNGVTGTFNWLYIDAQDIAYLHSGLYPVRDPGQSPDLPVWGDGRFEWASMKTLPADFFTANGGSTPYPPTVTAVAQGDPLNGDFEWQNFMTFAQHPQAVNPSKGWIASWNNSPAAGWWASDNNGAYGPTYRVDMLGKRLAAFQASGRKFDFANMVEIMADAGYTDLRGQEVLPLLLQLMQTGTLDDTQQQVVALMQSWIDSGSQQWINGQPGFGSWRRDRDGDGIYDERQAVLLMDAWYPQLIVTMLPQITAIDGGAGLSHGLGQCSGLVLQCPYDAPRAQGSAYQEGYFEFMKRLLQMVLDTPGHTDYRALKCAGTGVASDCRNAVLTALDAALTSLGGFSSRAQWDGTTLYNQQTGQNGETVETYDEIQHQDFSLLPVPPIRWINRPTFQQVVEVRGN